MKNRIEACIVRLRALRAAGNLSPGEKSMLDDAIRELEALARKGVRRELLMKCIAEIAVRALLRGIEWSTNGH